MKIKIKIQTNFKEKTTQIQNCIKNFHTIGILFGDGKRNTIKLFELEGYTINIKSFKVPNLINKIAYKYFRKSKARRSYEYALRLLENGIGTPKPIAFFENFDFIGLKDSYYISEHLDSDLTFRELVEIPDYPDHATILRQFTRFSFDLHEKGIEFLDHSPGNTLIKKNPNGEYDFYLVDLNRMNFKPAMDFESRMKNLSHLTPKKDMIEIMSNEYATFYTSQTEESIVREMWLHTTNFQERYARKQRIKKKLKFWKS